MADTLALLYSRSPDPLRTTNRLYVKVEQGRICGLKQTCKPPLVAELCEYEIQNVTFLDVDVMNTEIILAGSGFNEDMTPGT